jgi:hypothetical protein
MSSNETAEAIIILIKRVGKWILFSALILLLVFIALLTYSKIEDYFKNQPKVISSIKGIELDEKMQDFLFRNSGFALNDDKSNQLENFVYYVNNDKTLYVVINEKKVVRVTYACLKEYDYTSINGIECRSSGDDVLNVYDKKIRVQCLKNKSDENYLSYRVYDANEFGIRYHVISNKVEAFSVTTTDEFKKIDGLMNKNWTNCE